ncbi:TPA: ribose-phosphate diphosphokinase, partial [Candidatus Woesearchaeota archaeon]|nr:ribose-phosphate diphosphokinase [Candidatus Woesearchaeota archaeon]
ENYRALTTLVDAARRCDAKHITIVIPTFPYARQHKALGGESITASVVARQLEDLGVKRVMTVDIHKPEIGGFFRRAILDNFMPGKRMMHCVQQLEGYQKERTTISSADQGGVSRANFFAQTMGVPVVTIYKQRDYSQPNVVEKADLLGNVQWIATTSTPAQEGREVIIPEDMIDTGGTIVKACELLITKGAKSVLPMCSLPLFNGKALQRMDELYAKQMIRGVMGTNAVYHGEDFKNKHPWYLEVPIDDLIAEAVYRINHVMAITDLLS